MYISSSGTGVSREVDADAGADPLGLGRAQGAREAVDVAAGVDGDRVVARAASGTRSSSSSPRADAARLPQVGAPTDEVHPLGPECRAIDDRVEGDRGTARRQIRTGAPGRSARCGPTVRQASGMLSREARDRRRLDAARDRHQHRVGERHPDRSLEEAAVVGPRSAARTSPCARPARSCRCGPAAGLALAARDLERDADDVARARRRRRRRRRRSPPRRTRGRTETARRPEPAPATRSRSRSQVATAQRPHERLAVPLEAGARGRRATRGRPLSMKASSLKRAAPNV